MSVYEKLVENPTTATKRYMITVASDVHSPPYSIVCEGMYENVADWLLEILGDRPFGPGKGGDA